LQHATHTTHYGTQRAINDKMHGELTLHSLARFLLSSAQALLNQLVAALLTTGIMQCCIIPEGTM
jgi:hypothetical protein